MTHPDAGHVADARRRLARTQAALVAALLAGAPAPPGFDESRLRAEAGSLLTKRRRVTELARPDVSEALGPRYRGLFDAWAPSHPRPAGTTARADADAFAEWLYDNGHLPRPRKRRWFRPRARPERLR